MRWDCIMFRLTCRVQPFARLHSQARYRPALHPCGQRTLSIRSGLPNLPKRAGFRAMATKEELMSMPGVCTNPDVATTGFYFQHTNFRVKDPKVSLDFYTRVLGMKLLSKFDFPEMQFTLYFLGYESLENLPEDSTERVVWLFRQKGCLELTHNWGSESDDSCTYHSGNSDPRGFGHICVAVPDVYAACERFETLGVEFVKKPDGGKMKGIAFIKDPDGYWVEILNNEQMTKIV